LKEVIKVDEMRIQNHLDQVVRGTVEETLNAMLDAEADALCQAGRYEHTDSRTDTRAGHYQRKFHTKTGEVSLKIPKLRKTTFETAIIERYRRRESSIEEALIEMYLAGVSVRRVCSEKLSIRYRREDGLDMKIGRCLIDANWGQSTDVVYQFCRQSSFSGIVLPSHGKYVGASSIPFSEYKRKKGDRIGLHWRLPNIIGKRAMRHVLIDTNYWKSFVQARLSVAMGDPGCLSLFGRDSGVHRLLAEHLTAEYCVRTAAGNRVVDEWKLKAIRPDNHWLDCLVGCAVAASMEGVKLFGTEIEKESRPRRIRLSQVQKGRKICRK